MQNLCGLIGANTGVILCDAPRGIPKKMSVGGKVFQPADFVSPDAYQAAYKAAHLLPTGDSDKLFAFPEISGATDATEAVKTATLGYGLKQYMIEGRPAYEYQVIAGQQLFKQLRRFNRAIVPVITTDDANKAWHTGNSDGTANGEFAQIFVSGGGFIDGTKTQNVTIAVSYQSASDFNDSAKYMPLNFNPNEAKGLLSVVLSEYAAHAAGVYHIQALVETSQLGVSLNMVKDYATEMEDETLWVSAKVDGTLLAITSVVAVANLGWTVTFDATAYAALASGAKIFLSWDTPVILAAGDVTGVETPAPLIIVKP